jgi:hypothetical protein
MFFYTTQKQNDRQEREEKQKAMMKMITGIYNQPMARRW